MRGPAPDRHTGAAHRAARLERQSVTYAQTHPLLCVSLPHRCVPIGKALTLCVRCRAVALLADAETRSPRRWWQA